MKRILLATAFVISCTVGASASENKVPLIPGVSPEIVAGNPQGDLTVVKYFDCLCGHCKALHKPLKQFLAADPNVKVVYRIFPVFGKDSKALGRIVIAAAQQGKFEIVHHTLMTTQIKSYEQIFATLKKEGVDVQRLKRDAQSKAVGARLAQDIRYGFKHQINGTPTLVFGGKVIKGAGGLQLHHLRELAKKYRQKVREDSI